MAKINSMTGFATSKLLHEGVELSCEIRSLNSRYLEIFLKLPLALKENEDAMKDLIRKKVSRGKISCSVAISAGAMSLQQLTVNVEAVESYAQLLQEVRRVAGIEQGLQLGDLMEFKEIFSSEERKGPKDGLTGVLGILMSKTLDELNATRGLEGDNLRQDLEERLANILVLSEEIRVKSKDNAREEFERLYERLRANIDEKIIDRNRLELELALISDRVDISEEIVRLASHIELFRDDLQAGSPVGKKLNFLLQEMHREVNTMSTKTTRVEVSHIIVTVKEEVERMREQVQNIE